MGSDGEGSGRDERNRWGEGWKGKLLEGRSVLVLKIKTSIVQLTWDSRHDPPVQYQRVPPVASCRLQSPCSSSSPPLVWIGWKLVFATESDNNEIRTVKIKFYFRCRRLYLPTYDRQNNYPSEFVCD